MEKDLKSDVRKRFNDTFGINRLPMFSAHITALESEGHNATAHALKELLKEELAANNQASLNPDKPKQTGK